MKDDHLTTTKEQHWVYQSIINWESFSTNRAKLKEIADRGCSTFYFLRGRIPADSIHAYFGYYADELYLHFIPNSVDTMNSFRDESVIPFQLYSCLATTESEFRGVIEKNDAERRIQDWENPAIRNEVLDTTDFFQAFWIPNDDFQENTPLKINLAIHNNQVDLVITSMSKSNSFFDTCKPIPPFNPELRQTQFALLEKVKIWTI